MINENLTCQVKLRKNSCQVSWEQNSKNIGIHLSSNSKSLRSIYFVLVHPYINYANIVWARTNKIYLKIILGKQKQAARLMSSDGISIASKLLWKNWTFQMYTK